MVDNLLFAALTGVTGVIVGGMILDAYHERQRIELEAAAAVAKSEAADAKAELAAVRAELARSEALCDALSVEIAHQKARGRRMESLYAERMRNTIQTSGRTWN